MSETTNPEPLAAEPEALEELTFRMDERRVSFVLDEDLYPRDAIYGAAYLFVDRCFVYLARPADRVLPAGGWSVPFCRACRA